MESVDRCFTEGCDMYLLTLNLEPSKLWEGLLPVNLKSATEFDSDNCSLKEENYLISHSVII